jgi:multidrug efflux pump subunit AcrB
VTTRTGLAGRIAAAFLHSKLTPLLIAASTALGLFAVATLPREEEPQIVVPMVDVFVELPGASPAEVEQRITRPVEKLLWEVPGVEYVYSTSSPGLSTTIVRFFVGEDEARALVRLNEKLAAYADQRPPGSSAPLVKARSIDNVPILAITLWGGGYDDHQLRTVASQLREAIADVPQVSEVTVIGGRPREVSIELDPARIASAHLDPLRIVDALGGANSKAAVAGPTDGSVAQLEAGRLLTNVRDVRNVIVTGDGGQSVTVGECCSSDRRCGRADVLRAVSLAARWRAPRGDRGRGQANRCERDHRRARGRVHACRHPFVAAAR